MRPSAPHYLPWSLVFVGVLALLLLIPLLLVELHVVTFAYERLGLDHRSALALLLASLAGSAVNLPIARLPQERFHADRLVVVHGVPYVIPVVEHWPATILAVNLGGAVIPALLSGYLVLVVGHGLRLLAVTGLVALVTHVFSRPVPGVRAAAAYVGGTMGTLIGADLMNLGRLRGIGAPIASIGGAGTFDGIFVTGIVAVLLA